MKKLNIYKLDLFTLSGYVFFLFLIIWAIIVKEERIYISDPAYYFFNIVNKADFFYPGVRYTAIINQWPLVIATRLKLPLNQLLTVYSVSFVLVRLFYFYLVTNVFKNRAAAYAVIAISFIGVAESYFRPTSESTIALLNSISLYAWLCYADSRNWGKLKEVFTIFGSIGFIIFGYVSHPIALFSLFFVFVLYTIEYQKFKSFVPYISVFVLIVVFGFRVFQSNNGYHHDSIYGNLIHSPLQILNELEAYYPYKWFKNHFKHIYHPFAILAIATMAITLIKRKWVTAVFFISFSVVYFVIACASFKEGDANMQMEKIFLPNVMFAALTFVAVMRNYKLKMQWLWCLVPIVALLFAIFINLNKYKPRYTQRVNDLHKMVQIANKEKNRKLVITPDQIEHWPLAYCWAYGIETLLISSINEEMEPLTVFIARNPEEIKHKMEQPENFMPATFQTSYYQEIFNPDYFKLPEEPYILWEKDFSEL